MFDLSSIKVYKLSGEFICEAKRVDPSDPLANYLGNAKDIEDLKQKTKLKKQLEKRTETEFVNHLKRAQVHNPLLTMDLPEKQETDENEQFLIEVKKQAIEENFNGCFNTRYEKYEYLIKQNSLTPEDIEWLEEYKKTDEYEQLYEEEYEMKYQKESIYILQYNNKDILVSYDVINKINKNKIIYSGNIDINQINKKGYSSKGKNRGLGLHIINRLLKNDDALSLTQYIHKDKFISILTIKNPSKN